jgi:hypothetical protein
MVRADKPFKLPEQESARVVKAMKDMAEIVEVHSNVSACRHDPDNHVLECAIDGRADCIITGDLHLQELGSFQGVKIVTVTDFLK